MQHHVYPWLRHRYEPTPFDCTDPQATSIPVVLDLRQHAGATVKSVFSESSGNRVRISMLIGGGTCTAIGTADAALTTATCALVANGTLDSIEMQVTGVAATTVYWVAEVRCVQAL